MKTNYIISKKVYIAKIVTAKGNNLKFTILARDLESALTAVQARESYRYARSLSIKLQFEHQLLDIEYNETNLERVIE